MEAGVVKTSSSSTDNTDKREGVGGKSNKLGEWKMWVHGCLREKGVGGGRH